MVQKWVYEIFSNHSNADVAVLSFCGGIGCGLLTATIFGIFNKDCDFKEPACARGTLLLPPEEAVLYEPFWVSAEFGNKTEENGPYSSEEEVIFRTGGQTETVIIDCETEDPFWWKPDMILELFFMMQGKLNGTNVYPNIPQFWIRLAAPGQPGKQNTTACVALIQYALTWSLSNFQGVLIEADQLLNLRAWVWDDAKYGIVEFWNKFGKYQMGLIFAGNSCNDVFNKIPKSLLQKFDKYFYLDNFEGVQATEELPVVSVSKEYKDCRKGFKDQYDIKLVISDMANVYGYSNSPICIID